MKLRDSDKAILIILLGIAICALSIMYVAKPNFEDRQAIESECEQLQIRLDDLLAKEANRPMYEAGIVEYTEKFEAVLNCFPADLNQEITIMFLQGVKDSNDFTISSLGLGEESPFYTLGSAGTDATLPAATDESTDEGTEETASEDSAESSELVEGTPVTEDDLVCYSAAFPISYSGSYKSLKDVVAYVDSYSDRMTVDTLTISFDGDKTYSGSLDLSCYAVEGESRPKRTLELNQVEIGVDNIFEGTNGGSSGSSDSSLNKYNENDGAAIETSYDFYMMLNASTSDVSAKVLGQNGTGKESTVISNSDNTVSNITYEFYELDGKNYCRYTLDNSQSYEAEITSAEDVKLLIQSSERKNEGDEVGVKVTIRNSSSLPVYVKVSGDDAVSPRVLISKTGAVKVYQ